MRPQPCWCSPRPPPGQLEAGHKLKGAAPDANGTYNVDVDVNGAATGGAISLTLNAKDKPLLPVIPLLIGIGIGFVVEW